MTRTLANNAARGELLRRLGNLRPDSPAQWGTLDATRMLAHAGDSIAVALGEMPSGITGPRIFRCFPLKHLFIYVLPFPRGAKSSDVFLTTVPQDFASAKSRLLELMGRAAAVSPGLRLGTQHPFFGPLSAGEWQALAWKHLDHHLRQFGC